MLPPKLITQGYSFQIGRNPCGSFEAFQVRLAQAIIARELDSRSPCDLSIPRTRPSSERARVTAIELSQQAHVYMSTAENTLEEHLTATLSWSRGYALPRCPTETRPVAERQHRMIQRSPALSKTRRAC
jgi:hypothetical protein